MFNDGVERLAALYRQRLEARRLELGVDFFTWELLKGAYAGRIGEENDFDEVLQLLTWEVQLLPRPE